MYHLSPGRPRQDERGVTLIEIMIVVVILGIIIVPLTGALISFFRTTAATNNRLSESHDEQIASAYFAQDVQSLGVRDWSAAPYGLQTSFEQNAPATGGTYPCGPAGTPIAAIRMAWNDPTDASHVQTVIVSYVVEPVGGETQLHRLRCIKPASGATTLTSDLVLAHNVLLPVASPVVTGAATIPQSVKWTVNIKAPTDSGAPLAVILYGQRRQT